MKFDKYLRTILEQAGHEAERDGSSTIEAQHLLLAIAGRTETSESRLLSSVGLDPGGIREALDREFEHSLAAAGVSLEAFHLPRPPSAPEAARQLGASVRYALERGLAGVRKSPQPAHLLLGILQAELGTVPRALGLKGLDRAGLVGRIQQTLRVEQ
ncbi:MAG: Clp protease N-terminal domain-containing protein [Deltaproteobacteria bacterium]